MSYPYLPDKEEFSPEELQEQEKKFLQLLDQIMLKAKEFNVTMRVLGSIAIRIKAPEYSYIAYQHNRFIPDIDFVTYSSDIVQVQDLFFDLGWQENQTILRLFGNKRRIFNHPQLEIHADIFIDKLRFCHEINFKKRLTIDYPTISLIDLVLHKLQIVEINKKDLIDMMILLRKYPLSQKEEKDKINIAYLAKICSKDWGWWKTATDNLQKLNQFCKQYLTIKDAGIVSEKIKIILRSIEERPKSLSWKTRSIIGEKIRWYKEVEEVQR